VKMPDDNTSKIEIGTVAIKIRESSDWRMWFAPDCYWVPVKGGEPNWFHRWMQQLAFGVKWERIPRP
jgi:hypothetical protein